MSPIAEVTLVSPAAKVGTTAPGKKGAFATALEQATQEGESTSDASAQQEGLPATPPASTEGADLKSSGETPHTPGGETSLDTEEAVEAPTQAATPQELAQRVESPRTAIERLQVLQATRSAPTVGSGLPRPQAPLASGPTGQAPSEAPLAKGTPPSSGPAGQPPPEASLAKGEPQLAPSGPAHWPELGAAGLTAPVGNPTGSPGDQREPLVPELRSVPRPGSAPAPALTTTISEASQATPAASTPQAPAAPAPAPVAPALAPATPGPSASAAAAAPSPSASSPSVPASSPSVPAPSPPDAHTALAPQGDSEPQASGATLPGEVPRPFTEQALAPSARPLPEPSQPASPRQQQPEAKLPAPSGEALLQPSSSEATEAAPGTAPPANAVQGATAPRRVSGGSTTNSIESNPLDSADVRIGQQGQGQPLAGAMRSPDAPSRTPRLPQLQLNPLVQDLQATINTGQRRATITLNPQELGQVEVRLQMAADRSLEVVIAPQQAEAHQALASELNSLVEALRRADVTAVVRLLPADASSGSNGELAQGNGGGASAEGQGSSNSQRGTQREAQPDAWSDALNYTDPTSEPTPRSGDGLDLLA